MKEGLNFECSTILKSYEEAAKITGIGRDNFRKMANSNRDFPKISVGAKKMVIMNKLADWFSKHKGEQLC